jgi:hypothetical protein
MKRINAPTRDNGGKNIFRRLTKDETRMLAKFAARNGTSATVERFGVSPFLVRRSCRLNNLVPAKTRIDLEKIAKAAKGRSHEDTAAQFGVARSTVSRAVRILGRAST